VDGVAQLSIAPKDDGRSTVSVQHAKLPTAETVRHWKAFWADWFEALASSA